MTKKILFLLSLALLTACSQPDQVQTLSGAAQGTTWHVSVWQPGGVDVDAMQRDIDGEFQRLDKALSNYRPDSTIEEFNASGSTNPIAVGAEIVALVQTAQQVSEASGGCYDLTIKPLFDLWGFKGDTLAVPDSDSLARILAQVGYSKLEIQPPDQLRRTIPELRVDLSSIGQGYSVGRIAAVVENAGIDNYLVEIGGELQTRGHKPDTSHWRIGVERPLPDGRSVQKALVIGRDSPLAVMTSGTYRHYFDKDGKRYSHILDARTGNPVDHSTLSVTVLHDSPALADAWSTALLCLGQDAGQAVADRQGIAALFIAEDEGQLREYTSSAWQSMKDIEVQ